MDDVVTPMDEVLLWIDGRPQPADSGRMGDVYDPAQGRVVRRVHLAGAADVARAVAAAKAALPAWRATTPLRRARILTRFRELMERHRNELVHLASQEHGKTLADAAGSVQRGIEVIEFASGAPHLLKGEHAEDVGRGVDCHSLLQPVGVCAGITPFNFPVMVPLWMFPVAIACGNTFVLKPSEKVPSCSIRMAQLFQEAGLPDGVFNVVPGDREAVEALLAHPDVAAVSFVGSTPVARHVYETAARHGKRVQALGGAKNHAVVLPDADLDFTADALVGSAYGSAGERCMAISVVVAVGSAADPLVERLRARAAALRVGPGQAPGVDMGPVISAAHRDRIVGLIDGGVAQGARLLLDGRGIRVPDHEGGSSWDPPCSTTSRRRWTSTGRKSLARCWGWCGCKASMKPSPSSTATLTAMAPPSSPARVRRRAVSRTRSRWAWWASTFPSRYPWPSSPSAAGSSPCSGICTCTAWKASGSILAPRL